MSMVRSDSKLVRTIVGKPPWQSPNHPFLSSIEGFSHDKIKGLQLDRLRKVTRYVYNRSSFYRSAFRKINVRPSDIRNLSDLEKLPLTTPSMIQENQKLKPPFGDLWCQPRKNFGRVLLTSGSTGIPKKFFYTRKEWYSFNVESLSRGFWASGIRPSDMVAILYSFGPFGAPISGFVAADMIGAIAVPLGGFNTIQRLRTMRDLQVKAWFGNQSYGLYMTEVAKQEKFDMSDLAVDTIVETGEVGGSLPNSRKRLEKAWNAKAFDSYGLTDFNLTIAYECQQQSGLHVSEDMVFCEIIDPKTLHSDKPEHVSEGEVGVIVLTRLVGETCPWIRYVTGDLARIDADKCDCGRSFIKLAKGIEGRADDVFRAGGINIYPSAVTEFLRSYAQLGQEFEMVLTSSHGRDNIQLKVELDRNLSEEKHSQLAKSIQDEFKNRFFTSLDLDLVPRGTLPRVEGRPKRIKDERNKGLA